MFYHRFICILMFPSVLNLVGGTKTPGGGKEPTTAKTISPTQDCHQSFQLTNSKGTIFSPDQENCQEDFPVLGTDPHRYGR